ncbi:hypothetical protein AVEN_222161-1, partial [Araneus ventricosus]
MKFSACQTPQTGRPEADPGLHLPAGLAPRPQRGGGTVPQPPVTGDSEDPPQASKLSRPAGRRLPGDEEEQYLNHRSLETVKTLPRLPS